MYIYTCRRMYTHVYTCIRMYIQIYKYVELLCQVFLPAANKEEGNACPHTSPPEWGVWTRGVCDPGCARERGFETEVWERHVVGFASPVLPPVAVMTKFCQPAQNVSNVCTSWAMCQIVTHLSKSHKFPKCCQTCLNFDNIVNNCPHQPKYGQIVNSLSDLSNFDKCIKPVKS